MRFNIVLAALIAILAVPCWITIADESVEDFVDPNAIPMLFPGFSADPVMIVEIKRRLPEATIKAQDLKPEQQFEGVVFQRTPEGWVLVNDGPFHLLKMDADLIDRNILEHVLALRLDKETLVPQEIVNDSFRTDNDLTVETGITIRCLGQPTAANTPPPELAHLILGKTTKRGDGGKNSVDGYYVCNPNHPREVVIYEPKSQNWTVSLRPSDWADKRIHEFLRSEVDTFFLANALGTVGFKLTTANKWVPIPKFCRAGTKLLELDRLGMLRQEDVDHLLGQYGALKASQFTRGKLPQDAVGAEIQVRVTLKDGTTYSLHVAPLRAATANAVEAVASNHKFKFELENFWVGPWRRQDPKDLFHPK